MRTRYYMDEMRGFSNEWEIHAAQDQEVSAWCESQGFERISAAKAWWCAGPYVRDLEADGTQICCGFAGSADICYLDDRTTRRQKILTATLYETRRRYDMAQVQAQWHKQNMRECAE